MTVVEPFVAATEDAELADLRRRLSATRWPSQVAGDGWSIGTDIDYLRRLCHYWENDYDWRATEADLNRWTQFTTEVAGQRIHFVHVKSLSAGARPLMLLHGWPSTVLEFAKMIGPLTDPAAHGAGESDAFDVVVPSLPGFGWSGPVREGGWDVARIADALSEVMQRLGYERYGLMGGDWGSPISSHIALTRAEHVIGLYLTMVIANPLEAGDEPTPEEERFARELEQHLQSGSGYVAIQATKPSTLTVGLTDSPAGLASWMVEKFHAWTDHDGDLETALTRDEMLGEITATWLTGTAASSARLYRESFLAGSAAPVRGFVSVPTAVGAFPKELYRASRRQVERLYNVTHWHEFDKGGHFAALEQPDPLTDDLRAFFRSCQ